MLWLTETQKSLDVGFSEVHIVGCLGLTVEMCHCCVWPQPAQFPQRQTCSSMALPTATVPSGVNCSSMALPVAAVSPGVCLLWAYPWPHALRCSSTMSCATTGASGSTFSIMDLSLGHSPSEVYLLQHRSNRGHRHFEVCLLWPRPQMIWGSAPTLTHPQVPVPLTSVHTSSSLSRTAAQKQQRCRGHLPAQEHCHCCHKKVSRHSRIRWLAVQQDTEAKKQPLTSIRLQCTVRRASPMASRGVCHLIAKQQ